MFGRLKIQDGRRVYKDLDPLPLNAPGPYTIGPDSILCMQLSEVVGLLACWVSAILLEDLPATQRSLCLSD